jgi:hypothetical protein
VVLRFVSGLVCALTLLASISLVSATAANATMRISDDRGGRIGTYVDKYEDLRSSGEPVMIDGLCASACTIVLGAVAPERICVTSRANLGFHAAWDFGPEGRPVTNSEATRLLYSMYPQKVRSWISRKGGLKSRMIFLRGRELAGMYRPCSVMNANASANIPSRR